MNRAKTCAAILFVLATAVFTSAQTLKKEKTVLSTRDKKEIIKQVFEDGLEKLFSSQLFSGCLTPIVDERKVLFIVSNSDSELLSGEFNHFRLVVMSHSQISDEVKRNNGECYFRFGGFQIENSTVSVVLERTVDQIYRFENSSKYTRWLAGESFRYTFKKTRRWNLVTINKGALFS